MKEIFKKFNADYLFDIAHIIYLGLEIEEEIKRIEERDEVLFSESIELASAKTALEAVNNVKNAAIQLKQIIEIWEK